MKKVALLLGALSLVSSVAYAKEVVPAVEEVVVVEEVTPMVAAAPALTVTNFGQFIEVDNTSGEENIGEAVHFGNVVGLAYDDWTFGLMARKTWSMDTHDGIHSAGHRIDLDAWKNYENFSVGTRWRQEKDMDRYYLRTKYSYGMLSGWVDFAYQSNNGAADHEDNWYSEGMPIAVTYGPVTLGYYYEWDKMLNAKPDYNDDARKELAAKYNGSIRHQIRVMAPLYTGEKLSLDAEYRYQFAEKYDYKDKTSDYAGWDENNKHVAILNASYALTDNLTVAGYYQYEWNNYESHDKPKADHEYHNYYGEFCIGWDYKF